VYNENIFDITMISILWEIILPLSDVISLKKIAWKKGLFLTKCGDPSDLSA